MTYGDDFIEAHVTRAELIKTLTVEQLACLLADRETPKYCNEKYCKYGGINRCPDDVVTACKEAAVNWLSEKFEIF